MISRAKRYQHDDLRVYEFDSALEITGLCCRPSLGQTVKAVGLFGKDHSAAVREAFYQEKEQWARLDRVWRIKAELLYADNRSSENEYE
jgi:hypothetical protein